ncbi:MAG: hypothetical protein NC236_02170 [Mycoplasma sp.]|nr:hypothetical protein [Mycoplasma sp.]
MEKETIEQMNERELSAKKGTEEYKQITKKYMLKMFLWCGLFITILILILFGINHI